MMQIAPKFASGDPFADALRSVICRRLKDSDFVETELGRASHIILTLQKKVSIRCDRLKQNSEGNYDLMKRGLCCRYLILENFYQILDGEQKATGNWFTAFSYPEYLLESFTGSLEEIFELFGFDM